MDALTEFDPTTLEYTINPQALLGRYRRQGALHYLPEHDGWLVTRHREILQVLTGDNFTGFNPAGAGGPQRAELAAIDTPVRDWFYRVNPFTVENELHQACRRVLSHIFSLRHIACREAMVKAAVAAQMRPLRESGLASIELVPLLRHIPNVVLVELLGMRDLGVPERELEHQMQLFKGIFNPLLAGDALREVEQATAELRELVTRHIERSRDHPGDDLTTLLLEAVAAEDSELDTDTMTVILLAVFVVGSDTTLYQSLLCIVMLFEQPGLIAQLRRQPELLDAAIAEMLRFQHAGKLLFRYAKQPCELAGRRIEPGQVIFAPPQAANWDEQAVPDPERFDIHRSQQQSIPFGKGVHFCVGANLARMELRAILQYLLDHLPPGASLDREQIEWRSEDFIVREISSLPIQLRTDQGRAS